MSKESALNVATGTPAPVPAVTPPTPTVEPAGTNPITAEPKSIDSERFARLAKKEQQLVKEREAFKKEQESHKSERQKMLDIKKKIDDFEVMKQKDPVAALKQLGFTEADIVKFVEGNQPRELTVEEKAQKIAQEEVKKFKDEQSAKAQKDQEVRDTALIKQFKSNINKTIVTDKDKYEYCNYYGPQAEELIYSTVEQVLKDTGEVISTTEAAGLVEDFYENQDKAMNSLKKRTPKQDAKVETPAPIPAKSRTLTNKVAPTTASTTTTTKKESHSEKKERLVKEILANGLKR